MQVGQFVTEDDAELYYDCWPAGQDGPCAIYLHGLESHMGWFSNLAESLNSENINVYAFDRRGSGLNRHNSRNFSSRYISSDLKLFIDLVKRDHPQSPIFLIGLCLGGRIAVDFFSYYTDCLNGLILISPSLKSKLRFSLADKFSILFRPDSMLKIPIKDTMFTSNRKYLKYMENDSLRLRNIPAQHILEMAKIGQRLNKASKNIKLPVLLMLAGIDEIIDTKGAKRWLEKLPSTDKTLKFYKDYHHILTFEEDPRLVMEDIETWIKERSDA
jgi:alpha-beta hydrolase superfamily lysophospholipase